MQAPHLVYKEANLCVGSQIKREEKDVGTNSETRIRRRRPPTPPPPPPGGGGRPRAGLQAHQAGRGVHQAAHRAGAGRRGGKFVNTFKKMKENKLTFSTFFWGGEIQYLGRWYEVLGLPWFYSPSGSRCISANYGDNGDSRSKNITSFPYYYCCCFKF